MTQDTDPARWSGKRALAWWKELDWVCGFNYLPSTAVNFLEFWMADTWDGPTIERELAWAAGLGYNATRVNLHYLVWEHDKSGYHDRFARFLDVSRNNGISVVPVLFDDCGFGGEEPRYGRQRDPVPGVHNSRAVASPGRRAVMDRSRWPAFQDYVCDFVAAYGDDDRILFWDLYNEPGNRSIFTERGAGEFEADLAGFSFELMKSTFAWARSTAPTQPVTVSAWRISPEGTEGPSYDNAMDRTALELSDIVTFHAYCSAHKVKQIIDQLKPSGRPMLSTEWMARAVDSKIVDQLPLYRNHDVGCFNWGLVQGRTQTFLPWPHKAVAQHGGTKAADVWFHDILHPDGTPYDPQEADILRSVTGRAR